MKSLSESGNTYGESSNLFAAQYLCCCAKIHAATSDKSADRIALAFSLENCDGAALAGHTLTFTPDARQAGTSVVLTLRAVDTNGFAGQQCDG